MLRGGKHVIHMGFIEFQRCDDDDGQMVMTSDFEKKKESEFRGRLVTPGWKILTLSRLKSSTIFRTGSMSLT